MLVLEEAREGSEKTRHQYILCAFTLWRRPALRQANNSSAEMITDTVNR